MKCTRQRCPLRQAQDEGGVEDAGGGGLEALVVVGDHQRGAAQAPPGQGAQELGPEGLGLRGADRHAEDLAPALGIDGDGNDDDQDGDGWSVDEDCDDTDAQRFEDCESDSGQAIDTGMPGAGSGCACGKSSTVPVPASSILALLGLLVGLRRR